LLFWRKNHILDVSFYLNLKGFDPMLSEEISTKIDSLTQRLDDLEGFL